MNEGYKLSPWLRIIICAMVVCPSREDVCRRLNINGRRLRDDLHRIYKQTNSKTVWAAAVKLKIIKIDYEQIPDWLDLDEVGLAPGITCLISPSSNGDSISWQLEKPSAMMQPE
jgi:hypothetical protein